MRNGTSYVEQARRLDTPDYTEESAFNRLLGANIKRLRQLRGIEQKDVASDLRISQSGYSRLEGGQTRCTVYQLRRIASLLHARIGELIPR